MLGCMEVDGPASVLDTHTGVGRKRSYRPEVLGSMAGRRRNWTLEQKLAIVSDMARCDNITAFAREHDIRTSLLYTWRRELRYALQAGQPTASPEPMFVPVVAEHPRTVSDDGSIEVELGGAVVRIGRAVRADLAAAVLQALRASQ
jgi:transposase